MRFNLLLTIFSLIVIMSVGVGAIGTYPAVDTSMVLYYHFNNDSAYGENDTHVYDFSGNGNNGTANNTQFQAGTGILGDGSFSFNGNNASIKPLNNVVSVSKSLNFSVSALFLTTRIQYNQMIFSSTITASNRFGLYIDSSGYLIGQIYNGASYVFSVKSSSPIRSNVYYSVVYTKNDTSAVLYLNGLTLSSVTTDSLTAGASVSRIGSSTAGASFLLGNLDDFIVYNKTLNSSQVYDIYSNYLECLNKPFGYCRITSSTIFNGSSFYISNPMYIEGDGIIIDGNGSTIYYNTNNVSGGFGFYAFPYMFNNSVIKNLNLVYRGNGSASSSDAIRLFNSSNITIQNVNITIDNVLTTTQAINLQYCNNVTVYNVFSNISNCGSTCDNVFAQKNSDLNVSYNSFRTSGNSSYNVYFPGALRVNVNFNNVSKYTHYYYGWNIHPEGGVRDCLIYGNNILATDHTTSGVYIEMNSTCTVDSNYFFADDRAGKGVTIQGSSKNSIIRNNIFNVTVNGSQAISIGDDFGCSDPAVEVCGTRDGNSNITVLNNTIYYNSVNTLSPFAIVNENNLSFNNLFQDNRVYSSRQCFGSFESFNNTFNNNKCYSSTELYFFNNTEFINKINYLDGLSSSLIHNSTSICNGSSSNLASNTGNVNITLRPNEACWVYDNYNLTEGTIKSGDPLSFTSSSYTSKHIANALDFTLNTTISFIVRSCDAGTISYKSNTGLYSRDYQPGEYSCNNYYVTILNVPIEPATNSNEFTIAYNQAAIDTCSGAIDSFGSLTGFFAIFIIVVVAGGLLLLLSGNADSLGDSGALAMILVIVAIVLVLGGIIIVNIAGGTC